MPAIRAAVGGRWGKEVIGPDGEVDRSALAKIVFAPPPDGPRQLVELEKITHPEIRKRLRAEAEQLAQQGRPVAILDAPVMLKAGWDKLCDAIAFVDCPADQRMARALSRGVDRRRVSAARGGTRVGRRKKALSDFVLDNSRDVSYINRRSNVVGNRSSRPSRRSYVGLGTWLSNRFGDRFAAFSGRGNRRPSLLQRSSPTENHRMTHR